MRIESHNAITVGVSPPSHWPSSLGASPAGALCGGHRPDLRRGAGVAHRPHDPGLLRPRIIDPQGGGSAPARPRPAGQPGDREPGG